MDLSKNRNRHKTRTSHVRRWVWIFIFVILGCRRSAKSPTASGDQIWPTTVIPFGLQTIRMPCVYIFWWMAKAFARRFHSLGLFESSPVCRIRWYSLLFSLYLLLGFQWKWYRLQSVHGAEDCFGYIYWKSDKPDGKARGGLLLMEYIAHTVYCELFLWNGGLLFATRCTFLCVRNSMWTFRYD